MKSVRARRGWDVLVVGGALAGSRLAGALARGGARVALIEPHPGAEKPCGGWLPVHASQVEPLLDELALRWRRPSRYCIETPRGSRQMANPGYRVVARAELDGALFGWALAGGARHLAGRACGIEREPRRWRVQLAGGAVEHGRVLVGADGCGSAVRRALVDPFGRGQIMVTLGMTLPAPADEMRVALGDGLVGYLWYLPRPDHASVGICAPAAHKAGLRDRLLDFARRFAEPLPAHRWGAPIPMLTAPERYRRQLCGDDWLLVGDAAGMANAVTGEGIAHALRSAQVAAAAILSGRPRGYGQRIAAHSAPLVEAATAMAQVLAAPDPVRAYRFAALEYLWPALGRFDLA
ncbi:MAG: NAD(P)/FAD-dependent oxidoreductase [Deltaproteobacteria bacterium]|nr:NAD(P)/FAD-dependent oxidoreductase [Deltaproteobacteria bacterium]